MKGYGVLKVLPVEQVQLFERATRVVSMFEDGDDVRCHEVVRAVARILEVPDDRIQDGRYGRCDHSWIWLGPWSEGNPFPNILDAYAVARVPLVQLVDMGFHHGFGRRHLSGSYLYDPGPRRTDVRERVVDRLAFEHGQKILLARQAFDDGARAGDWRLI